jgi:predicted nuclease with TOPRIM domain
MDLNTLTRNFLLGEQKENFSIQFHLNAISESLKSLCPKTQREKMKIFALQEHIKHIRKKNRVLEEKMKVLEEQVQLLEEGEK